MNEIEEGLKDLGFLFTAIIKGELNKHTSLKDSKILNDPKSITYEVEKHGDNEYELVMKLPGYAVWIDQGRGKNKKMPPIKDGRGNMPIRDWMKRKNIPLSAEFAIRKTIGIRGIKARPFLDSSLNKFLPQVNESLRKESTKLIIKDLDKILDKIR